MPELLHEYWENDDGGAFSPVTELGDRQRPQLTPNSRLVFAVRASSWFEAMQRYQERLGYGDYTPPEDVPDHIYTDAEFAEQEAYLRTREV